MNRDFSTRLASLEYDVEIELRGRINKSKNKSKHVDEKCISVNVFDYKELAIVNGELTFIDKDGLQYNLYCECTLTDLIDIINFKK